MTAMVDDGFDKLEALADEVERSMRCMITIRLPKEQRELLKQRVAEYGYNLNDYCLAKLLPDIYDKTPKPDFPVS